MTSTKTDQIASTAKPMPRPSWGISGITMPTNPPTTQATWSIVSERANALVCTRSGTYRWIVESSDSLDSDWASPAVRPSSASDTTP